MSTLTFTSLGSGSSGNGTIIRSETTTLLVDCGWSKRETLKRLTKRGIQPEQIDALLVTHRHGDHSKGVEVFTNQFWMPVCTSHGTMYGRRQLVRDESKFRRLHEGEPVQIGDISILPIRVPHDCIEPLQFVFTHDNVRFGLLTDIGHITDEVKESYQLCDTIFVESNHDLDMLWNGAYPENLKQRIAGNFGHLNNEQTLDFLQSVWSERLNQVVIGHISQENNSLDLLHHHFVGLEDQLNVSYALQETGTDWFTVANVQ
ncbi:MAG: MBL fold metallo-hydrolase [Gammaproteobacteria bacterium]|nr:MBL fold metallo-hydrolase [Gammaproteobacteria bacterium]